MTGRLADRVIDAGGTVVMSETLELLGGEEMLGRRAVTPEVAAKVKGIIQRTLDYAAERNRRHHRCRPRCPITSPAA